MHKADAFFYFIIAFLVGTFSASVLPLDYRWVTGFIIAGGLTVIVSGYQGTFARMRKPERNRLLGLFIGVMCLAIAGGIARYNYFSLDHSVLKTFAEHQAKGKGIPVTISGYVDAEETISSGGNGQLIVKAVSLTSDDKTLAVSERVMVTTSPSPQYSFGQKLTLAGALNIPQNFDGFDYVQYLKNKDIATVMFRPTITAAPQLGLPWPDRLKLAVYQPLFSVKNAFENSLRHSLPSPSGDYIVGVLLGGSQNLPQSLKDAFNKTSTTHILAISGYNITIIADALLAVLVFFVSRRKAFWLSVGVIALFVIMTGATASVVRAAVMGLLLLAAQSSGRLYSPRNAIIAAAGVMVLLTPSILVFDVGFQLSFLAVIGLITIYPVLEKKTSRWSTLGGLKETLLMTISAQLAVAPLLVYYFHQFSLVALIPNILVLPLMPYTMLAGFVTGAAGLIWLPLGRIIGLATLTLSAYQLGLISWFGNLPFASLNIGLHWITLSVIYLLLIYIIWRASRNVEKPTTV